MVPFGENMHEKKNTLKYEKKTIQKTFFFLLETDLTFLFLLKKPLLRG